MQKKNVGMTWNPGKVQLFIQMKLRRAAVGTRDTGSSPLTVTDEAAAQTDVYGREMVDTFFRPQRERNKRYEIKHFVANNSQNLFRLVQTTNI